jgi:hypothetical protein
MLFVCDFCNEGLKGNTLRFFMLPATRVMIENDGAKDKIVQPCEEEYRTVCYHCLGVSK